MLKNSVIKRNSFGTSNNFSQELYIGYGINAAFTRPLGVNLTSLVINNPDIKFNVHVFASAIDVLDIERLRKLTEIYHNLLITLYSVDDEIFKNFPTKIALPVATYFRFLIPAILSHIDYYLYLDADILCLRSIADIFNINLNDAVAATARDAASGRAIELGISSEYFNAGVMLINIKKWNEENISNQAINLLLHNPEKYLLLDQDVLNIVLENRIKTLPSKWNQMYKKDEKTAIFSDTILVHYAGRIKPWKCACNSKEQPVYLHYEQQSPWSGLPLELPANYKEARSYAKILIRKGNYSQGLKWLCRYAQMKFKARMLGNF